MGARLVKPQVGQLALVSLAFILALCSTSNGQRHPATSQGTRAAAIGVVNVPRTEHQLEKGPYGLTKKPAATRPTTLNNGVASDGSKPLLTMTYPDGELMAGGAEDQRHGSFTLYPALNPWLDDSPPIAFGLREAGWFLNRALHVLEFDVSPNMDSRSVDFDTLTPPPTLGAFVRCLKPGDSEVAGVEVHSDDLAVYVPWNHGSDCRGSIIITHRGLEEARRVPRENRGTWWTFVIVHEVLHALGFKHDDSRLTIMNSVITENHLKVLELEFDLRTNYLPVLEQDPSRICK